ncbi:phage tail tube protein [Salmonella enterica]|uniref:phage tail tube protein n=1 Tax=Salmonella enterica TaxID=28901 RepID=UPI0021E4F1C6|nr:phage tail protein [Salmonella enterica]
MDKKKVITQRLPLNLQYFARNKNALRLHFVQAYEPGTEEPGEEWFRLAKYISTIGDDTQEGTEETAYYDGDGTPETDVISVAGAYTPEGLYDPEDPAQALIAGLKYKTGVGRKIWHKVVSADGTKEWVGRATVSAIVAGAGDASAYETFSCNIRFDSIPKETDLSGE